MDQSRGLYGIEVEKNFEKIMVSRNVSAKSNETR